MIFQGPKGYKAQICEIHLRAAVWKQYNKMAVSQFFQVNFILIYILFSDHGTLYSIVISRMTELSMFLYEN